MSCLFDCIKLHQTWSTQYILFPTQRSASLLNIWGRLDHWKLSCFFNRTSKWVYFWWRNWNKLFLFDHKSWVLNLLFWKRYVLELLVWYNLLHFCKSTVNLRGFLRSNFLQVINFLNGFLKILQKIFWISSFPHIFSKATYKNLFDILILSKRNFSIHKISWHFCVCKIFFRCLANQHFS